MKILYDGNVSNDTIETMKSKHGIEFVSTEEHKRQKPIEKINKALAKKGIGLQFIKSKDPVAAQAKRFTKTITKIDKEHAPDIKDLELQDDIYEEGNLKRSVAELKKIAQDKGIKYFRILNKEELILVLRMKRSGATEEQMKEEVIDKAKARWKSGWTAKAAATVAIILMATNLAFADLPTRGEASFYTVESCHREGTSGITASRQPLNDSALTCALPSHYYIGKRIRVTNTKNGKSVIVKCNDYGPNAHLVYQHNRIIDLSQAAFKKIANLRDGTAQVEIEVL